ncbi:MAG: glycoside hydrolase [Planctomycetes bacterium]|nr:glycoside hydrolase [Planctomycetota bacterium]
MRPVLAIALLLAFIVESQAQDAPVHLFVSGKEGYPRYRIPSLLVAPNGDLLAVCEGRKDGGGLKGKIDIVLKRSSDLGKTWSKIVVVASDGDNTLGNPCLLADRKTGMVWMGLTRSLGTDTEEGIVAGTSKERTRVLVTSSKDSGKTWSEPLNISETARDPKWTWYGTGPGTGIQLKSGRLVIPAYHAHEKDGIYRSHMVFSDDGGKSWKRGDAVGRQIGECHVVEKQGGGLVLNARTNEGKERRAVAVSKDGGETWSEAEHDALFDPNCQGCVIRLPDADGKPRWLFSNPAGPKRRDLTVRLSTDEGKTWPRSKLLQAGDAQYSSLTLLSDGTVGCLFDRWEAGNYQLYYTRFRLDELE